MSEKINSSDLVLVFTVNGSSYYLGTEARNIILYEEKISTKGKNKGNLKIEEKGYYISGRALFSSLSNLYLRNSLGELRDSAMLDNLEAYVLKVEEIVERFKRGK